MENSQAQKKYDLFFKCKICGAAVRSEADSLSEYLCPKCAVENKKKLHELEEISPFLKEGVFSKDSSENSSTDTTLELKNYQQIEAPGTSSGILGKGSYGEVWLVKHKKTKECFAMKLINKKYLGYNSGQASNLLQSLEREIEIQKRLSHENIVKLHHYMSDENTLYIIMEYASKGTLFQLIRAKGKLKENEAFYLFVQACSAVHFLHKHNLIHRDIKPENLLLTHNGHLKLCDFGCCAPFKENEGRKTFCGTIEYMSPEIVKREPYNTKADIWSLGVLLYEMLHGHAPFRGFREQDTLCKILENSISFDEGIQADVRMLINSILQDDQRRRPNVIEILNHPWCKRMQKQFKIPDKVPSKIKLLDRLKNAKICQAGSGESSPDPQEKEDEKFPVEQQSLKNPPEEEEKEGPKKTCIIDEIPKDVLYGYPGYSSSLQRISTSFSSGSKIAKITSLSKPKKDTPENLTPDSSSSTPIDLQLQMN